MRKIFLSFILIAAGNFAVFGQGSSGQDMMAKASRQDLDRLKPKLEEYRQGKRDAHDGYVIMFRMLQDYARLKEGGSPKAKALFEEFNQLKKQHPEAQKSVSWVVHSGSVTLIKNDFYTKGEKAAREAEKTKEQKIKEEAKTWEPSDINPQRLFGFGKRLVVQYQYKLAFYDLPPSVTIKNKFRVQLSNGMVMKQDKTNAPIGLFSGGQEIPFTQFSPNKVMTFRHRIRILPHRVNIQGNPNLFDHPFWACIDLMNGYTPYSSKERKMVQEKGFLYQMPWTNSSGQYDNFCGAINLDGSIVYRLPIRQHLPDRILSLYHISPDGKRTVIIEGRASSGVDDEFVVDPVRKTLIWEYPDKLKTMGGFAQDGKKSRK